MLLFVVVGFVHSNLGRQHFSPRCFSPSVYNSVTSLPFLLNMVMYTIGMFEDFQFRRGNGTFVILCVSVLRKLHHAAWQRRSWCWRGDELFGGRGPICESVQRVSPPQDCPPRPWLWWGIDWNSATSFRDDTSESFFLHSAVLSGVWVERFLEWLYLLVGLWRMVLQLK